MKTIRTTTKWAAAALAATLLSSCSDEAPAARTITAERTWQPPGQRLQAGASSAERFGYERSRERPPASGGLAWTTPAGWRELPASSMRSADFRVAGDERAECYLTILAGDGGGLLANVNRWRGQMGLDEIGADELAAAPRAPLMGSDALLVDLEGTWTGMSGAENGDGYRLVGLLAVDGGRARFLKMVGPSNVVSPEIDAFLALAASMRAAVPARADPHAGLDVGAAAEPRPSRLAWTAPETWRPGPARAMREVTFFVGADGEGECYVTLLGGNGGGAFANVNRWRNQMGQTDLSPSEFADLERLQILETEGVLVEVGGTYRGMGDVEVAQAALLGAVCELPDRAVFVKMIGPEDVVHSARDDFLSFCKSLRDGG